MHFYCQKPGAGGLIDSPRGWRYKTMKMKL